MKFLLGALLSLSSVNAFAYGSIVLTLDNKSKVEIAWLGNDIDQSEVEVAYENGGAEAIFNGKLCYKGTRKEAMLVLNNLSENDFLSDEFRIVKMHYVGRDKFTYSVHDGPNEWIVNENVVSACK